MLRLIAALVLCFQGPLSAGDRFVVDDDAFIEKAIAAATGLHKAGKLVSFEKLRAQLDRTTCQLQRPEPRTEKMQPPEIFRLIKESTVAVATFYQCTTCKKWHLDTASGFVAADGVVSTSEHVVNFEDEEMKEGFLVVTDSAGNAYPVAEILASNGDADTCLLSVPGLPLKPLPLNPSAQVGDHVYCLSHPDGNHWMFTQGMLSRFFINREADDDGDKPAPTAKVRPSLYINITAEFSPGSSGAPVVDECGNVVGQVQSMTSSVESEEAEKGKTVTASYGMPLRSCVSAEEIAKLIRQPAKKVVPKK